MLQDNATIQCWATESFNINKLGSGFRCNCFLFDKFTAKKLLKIQFETSLLPALCAFYFKSVGSHLWNCYFPSIFVFLVWNEFLLVFTELTDLTKNKHYLTGDKFPPSWKLNTGREGYACTINAIHTFMFPYMLVWDTSLIRTSPSCHKQRVVWHVWQYLYVLQKSSWKSRVNTNTVQL